MITNSNEISKSITKDCLMPLVGGGSGLSLNSPSEGADERLSVERPLRLLSGFDKLTTELTLAGVGGGGPRGRLELVVLAKLVAEPCNFLNCGISPLGKTSLAPAKKRNRKKRLKKNCSSF
jgi:hypothetical protein